MLKTTQRNKHCKNSNNHKINGPGMNKIGSILGIQDKNGNWLYCGDYIKCGKYEGRIFCENDFGKSLATLCLNYSLWYGDNEFDPNCYGKAIHIKLDNGSKMQIERIHKFDEPFSLVINK